MLSKQLWRLLSSPTSLLSRVLRARYFPDGNVLSAGIGCNPSYTWRSLHAALDVIRAGFRWRIGCGRAVQVWLDPWIPRLFSFRVLSPPGAQDPHLRVCDLIDAQSKDWDRERVRALFWHEEAEVILAIPLSSVDGEDFFVWHHTANGDPCEWVDAVAKGLSANEFDTFITLCWALWWNRNRALNEHVWLSAGDLVSFAANYLTSFQQLNISPVKMGARPAPTHWVPPEPGAVKLNFDGAVFASSSAVGLGVVARDSAGACVWWQSVQKQGIFPPEVVEAFAAREAILLARRFGWRRIILEGDCAALYSKLISSSPDCSALGSIVRDVKCVASFFDYCLFSLVRRSGNQVAHCLARGASLSPSEGSGSSPSVSELLISDIA
ncbi:UNVERIFIED_CONTAM: putative mitochondrial protein [Sesamum radiatum]|uniref:Mitochondrial protein n=1 Tax=Sesamum radiatum TaxID=300843 RepID=A0AAW2W235_SESRA